MREFAVLVCAHILGDFLFQTDWMARNKKQLKGWLPHVVIHGALVYLMSMQWGLSGEYIGNLERTLIFLLILIGQPGAIGFMV